MYMEYDQLCHEIIVDITKSEALSDIFNYRVAQLSYSIYIKGYNRYVPIHFIKINSTAVVHTPGPYVEQHSHNACRHRRSWHSSKPASLKSVNPAQRAAKPLSPRATAPCGPWGPWASLCLERSRVMLPQTPSACRTCDGRVVKALDLKSSGIYPRRFESCSRQIFWVVLVTRNRQRVI